MENQIIRKVHTFIERMYVMSTREYDVQFNFK